MQKCPSCGTQAISGSLFCESCGASLTQVQAARKLRQTSFDSVKDAKEGLLNPGERLKYKHTYIIEEAIARSGFGATFRASRKDGKENENAKPVLIKQMIDQSSYDQFKDAILKSFKREAKFLKKIKHPAFPRGYEYFERNKSFYLVMDFINGKELAKAIDDYRKTTKSVEDGLIVYLGMEIADALEVVHSQGYIYRDMKPQNIMLDGISGRVKMIDFGTLYHHTDRDPLLFESEGYTPKEFMDKSKRFLPSGDIYSLGALLYELAMGETPKWGDLGQFKYSKIDERLRKIIEKCLHTDPAQRFQRASQVRNELHKLTKKGFWPFRNRNAITPVELAVLPKTLYPPACVFCEYCGHADPASQAGYCKNCRVPLKVGRLIQKVGEAEKEFFLYSDQTIIGSNSSCHFPVSDKDVNPQHIKIFRRKTGLWLEAVLKDKDNTLVNRRKVIGPVELLDGDTVELASIALKFSLRDAC